MAHPNGAYLKKLGMPVSNSLQGKRAVANAVLFQTDRERRVYRKQEGFTRLRLSGEVPRRRTWSFSYGVRERACQAIR